MKKVLEILNSEGPILALFEKQQGEYVLGSFLEDGSGTLYYGITIEMLRRYIKSEVTLNDIFDLSEDFIVELKGRKQKALFIKEDFKGRLQRGSSYYKDIGDGMKSKEFEKMFGV